jgi:hypothetical protein
VKLTVHHHLNVEIKNSQIYVYLHPPIRFMGWSSIRPRGNLTSLLSGELYSSTSDERVFITYRDSIMKLRYAKSGCVWNEEGNELP